MKRPSLAEMSAERFDLLVVGGGIIGCGIARDAALRGLRVALVERDDFGCGTTSRSTRLIHGGLRYLELFDFGLVRADLRERETLLRIAPHLVRPLPFLVPMYRLSTYQRVRLKAGMVLYDALSFDRSLPGHRFLSRRATLAAEPKLAAGGLQGAACYYDGQVEFPERLCLENALDAALAGALLRNHTAVEKFVIRDGRVEGAHARDTGNDERATLRARLVLNATGPWLDRTLAHIRSSPHPLLRTTRGVHIVTPRLGPNAVVLFARSDRRLFFVVPWNGMSLIGTTDTDESEPPETVRADGRDVEYLVDETRRAFPGLANLRPDYTMAGVRALVRQEGVRESEVSRRHALLDHGAEDGPEGLVSVVGGKITGYRAIAEDAVDLACRKLGRIAPCRTDRRLLPGAPPGFEWLRDELRRRSENLGLAQHRQDHLARHYGGRALRVLDLICSTPELAEPLCPDRPTILAEIVHAAREEAASSLSDVLLRRTSAGLSPGQAVEAAPRAAETLGRELGWGASEQAAEVARYRSEVARLHVPDGEP